MKLDFTSILFLFAAFQAVFLIVGINLKKPFYSDLKKITSFLLTSMILVLLYYVVIFNGFMAKVPFMASLGTAAWMSIPPFYYLLFKSIQNGQWSLKWTHFLYFPISILFIIEMIGYYLGFRPWIYGLFPNGQLIIDTWMFVFLGTGLVFTSSSIRDHFQQEKENKQVGLIWFSYLLFGTFVFYSILYLIIRTKYIIEFELTLIALFCLFIFALIMKTFKIMSFRNLFDVSKYDNQKLQKKDIQVFAQKLERIMDEEKPYLKQGLNLNELSKLSEINANTLSQLFHNYYLSNFYEFVNRYRLNYLESLILDPEKSQYKIMALAEESGFKSKATFYKVFKEKHQLTPAQYIKKYSS